MGRRVSSSLFVGRAADLAWLHDAYAQAAAGRPIMALVGGDSGVGKTRLVSEFVAGARVAGSRVLMGSCPLIRDGELPFAPITEALRGLVRDTDRDDLLPIVGPSVPDLRRLLPELARVVPVDEDGGTTQARLYDAFLGVLERAAGGVAPTVLVIEDLQWADRATREMMAFLGHNIANAPVLMIGSYREDESRPGSTLATLLGDLDRTGITDRRLIHGLSIEETAAHFEAVSGERQDRRTVAELHDRTQGNPYLLEELIASRGPDGALPASAPASIREQVSGRIAALPAESQEVLRLAATIGRRSPHRLFALTSRFPELILLAALREAVRQHVLIPITEPGSEGYAFRQGIFQEVIYDDLLPGERQNLHRAVAEALTAHPDLAWGSESMAASSLARHWLAAGDRDRALDAALGAARAARATFAFAEAQHHLEVALDLLDRAGHAQPDRRIGFRPKTTASGDRDEILAQAAEAAHLSGNPIAAVQHGRALADLPSTAADPGRASRRRSRLGRYLADAGELVAAVAEQRLAVSIAADGGAPSDHVRALADLARTLDKAGQLAEAVASATSAIVIARQAGLEAEVASLLMTLAVVQSRGGHVDEGLHALEEARGIRATHGLSRATPRPSRIGTIVRSYAEMAEVLALAGATEASEAASRQAADLAAQLGAGGSWGRFLESNSAAALYHLGRWDDAERAAAEVVAGHDRADDATAIRATITRARIDVGRGRFGEAQARFETIRAVERGDLMTVVELAVGLAELALWRRQTEEAMAALDAGRERMGSAEDPAPRAMLDAMALRALADMAGHARARRSASDVASATDEAGPWLAEARGLVQRLGPAAGSTILRADPTSAEAEWLRLTGEPSAEAWSSAADRWRSLREPYQEAYARWREAEASLQGRGDRGSATAAARAAYGLASSLGAVPLVQEVEALARRARLELQKPEVAVAQERPEAALGLSPREFEVLLLVADGRTNRQIAETLFITEKTAGHHVSNLLGKLGVASRVEAAALAHRLGLLSATLPAPDGP